MPKHTSSPKAVEEIPNFLTFGRNERIDDIGFVHVETVMARRSLHNGHVPAHRHEQIVQLCWWFSGSGTYLIEDRRISFAAPMFVFVPTHLVHGFDVSAGSDAIVFSIAADWLQGTPMLPAESSSGPIVIGGRDDSPPPPALIGELMHAGHARYRQDATTADGVIRGLSAAILAEAVPFSLNEAGELRSLATKARQLVEQNFRKDWNISQYAESLGHTPYQINDATQSAFGRSLKRLVMERRLLECKRLLAFTIRPIESIAPEAGISDASYFSRFFHDETGISPRDWRRAYLAKTGKSIK